MIRLLLQKQSDLGLRCLSWHFLQAPHVQNFRTSTVPVNVWVGIKEMLVRLATDQNASSEAD